MKYKILPFIIGIMLAGCNGRPGNVEQTATSTDSIPKTTIAMSLMDSVRTPEFKKLISNDSIQLLGVKHFMADTFHGEEILYLDYRISNSYSEIKRHDCQEGIIKLLNCHFTDTLAHINNPFPEMNGVYVTIYKYHGLFVTFYDEGERTPSITDTSIFIEQMMSVNCPYISAKHKDGDVIAYNFMEYQNPVSIDIKKLGGKYDAQLWKGFGRDEYELRVPIEKTISIPELVYTNNIGIAAGNGFDIKFDHINYDSLFNSK